jgi:hypothetical protein
MPPEASNDPIDSDIHTLSSAEASAVLDARAVDFREQAPLAPATAHEADVRLQQLISDPEWSRRLMNGDIATRDEFQRLSELKASGGVGDAIVDQSLVDVTTGDQSVQRSGLISWAEGARARGFPNEAIEHFIAGGKFTPETVATAQWWLPRMRADPTLLYPDWPPVREFQMEAFDWIISAGTMDMP